MFFFKFRSPLERLNAMERHSFLSTHLLLISARCNPVHRFTLSIHVALGLPLLVPDVIRSRVCCIMLSFLFTCPRYTNLCFLMFWLLCYGMQSNSLVQALTVVKSQWAGAFYDRLKLWKWGWAVWSYQPIRDCILRLWWKMGWGQTVAPLE